MASYWQDKAAIVTGSSSGLGKSIAAAFAQAGARVCLAARGVEALEAAAEELRRSGHKVLAVPTDVTDQAQVDALVKKTVAEFGGLDVMVNNAGRSARGAVIHTSIETFRELIELNFIGVVRCTRAAVEHLIARRGHLVNIGSLAGKSAARYLGAYPVSKFAVSAYTQQLRLELGPEGLHTLLVSPGPIASDKPRRQNDEQLSGLPASAAEPGGGVKTRLIPPDKLARMILRACERRQTELIVPSSARLLFAIQQLSPRLGDWLVRRMT